MFCGPQVLLHRRLCTGSSHLGNHDPTGALRTEGWQFASGVVKIVQLARPQVQPNEGFLRQLADFHEELERL